MKGKLVRDKIPDIIMNDGKVPTTIILIDDSEYNSALIEKLYEEVQEFNEARSAEELADILEVVYALGNFLGCTEFDLNTIRIKKRIERGGFEKKVFLFL